MGCDIHIFAEVKRQGKWEKVTDECFTDIYYETKKSSCPFDWRSYAMYGFLADVRNYSNCKPISETKGLPLDSEYLNSPSKWQGSISYGTEEPVKIDTNYDDIREDWNYHSHSYLTLKELLQVDYEETFWDRRITRGFNGASISEEGEGTMKTYREHLGETFFKNIEELKQLGSPEDVRVIFWFDN